MRSTAKARFASRSHSKAIQTHSLQSELPRFLNNDVSVVFGCIVQVLANAGTNTGRKREKEEKFSETLSSSPELSQQNAPVKEATSSTSGYGVHRMNIKSYYK
eukprot:6325685-Prymnesium_polylepis.2